MVSIDHSTRIAQFGEELVACSPAHPPAIGCCSSRTSTTAARRSARSAPHSLAQGAVAGNIRFAVLIDNVRSSPAVDYRARSIDRRWTEGLVRLSPGKRWRPRETLTEEALEVPERLADPLSFSPGQSRLCHIIASLTRTQNQRARSSLEQAVYLSIGGTYAEKQLHTQRRIAASGRRGRARTLACA
jgi:hypothetical protein